MPDAVDRFVAAARAAGIEPEVNHFPQGTRTAVDAAAAVGCDVAQIVKSLVFVVDDDPVLALTSGANRVDVDRLAAVVDGTSSRQATADEVKRATGFAIGGTPPFGHPTSIRTVVDRDLLAYDVVWAAAGSAATCFPLAPDQLVVAANATVADVAEKT